MYISKQEKVNILKFYIRKYVNIEKIDLDKINSIDDLCNIIRTNKDVFGQISECKGCCRDGTSFNPKCGVCESWNWQKCDNPKDNYSFRYQYWKKFCDYETGGNTR